MRSAAPIPPPIPSSRLLAIAAIIIVVLAADSIAVPIVAHANSLPLYYLPWASGESHTVSQGNNGSFSHTGLAQFAWDFAGDGFSVRAARAGVVEAFDDTHATGGCDPRYQNLGNWVLIRNDGYDVLYLHLLQGSVSARVSLNQTIQGGTAIAVSDSSGYVCPDPTPPATCPPTCPAAHLHFMVENYCAQSYWCQSVAASFLDADVLRQNADGVPTSVNSYVSSNVAGGGIRPYGQPLGTTPAGGQIREFGRWNGSLYGVKGTGAASGGWDATWTNYGYCTASNCSGSNFPEQLSGQPAAVSDSSATYEIFSAGTLGNLLMYQIIPAGTCGFTQLTAPSGRTMNVGFSAVGTSPGRVDVFILTSAASPPATTPKIYHGTFLNSGAVTCTSYVWQGWDSSFPTYRSGFTFTTDLVAASSGNGEIAVASRVLESDILYERYVPGTGWNSIWYGIGASPVGGLAIAYWPGYIHFLERDAANANNQWWDRYLTLPSTFAWDSGPNSTYFTPTSDMQMVSWYSGRYDLFARSSAGEMWHNARGSGGGWDGWNGQDLGSPSGTTIVAGGAGLSTPGGLAATTWGYPQLDTVAVMSSTRLYHKCFCSGSWGPWDILPP